MTENGGSEIGKFCPFYFITKTEKNGAFLWYFQYFIIRTSMEIILNCNKNNIYKQNCYFLNFSMLGTKWGKIFNVIIYRTFYHFLFLNYNFHQQLCLKKLTKIIHLSKINSLRPLVPAAFFRNLMHFYLSSATTYYH